MISITLQFNSIEAARAALLEIPTTALVAGDAPKPAQAQEPAAGQGTAKADAAPKRTAAAKAPAAAPAETAPPASTAATEGNDVVAPSAPEAPAAPTASSSEPVEYPVLQKAVFALAGKNREAAAGLAQSFGVKTFKELPAEKWADALAAVNAKLAELGA